MGIFKKDRVFTKGRCVFTIKFLDDKKDKIKNIDIEHHRNIKGDEEGLNIDININHKDIDPSKVEELLIAINKALLTYE